MMPFLWDRMCAFYSKVKLSKHGLGLESCRIDGKLQHSILAHEGNANANALLNCITNGGLK